MLRSGRSERMARIRWPPLPSMFFIMASSLRGAKISPSPPLPVVSTHLMSPVHGVSREAIRPGVHAGFAETANTDRNPVYGVSRQTGFSPADAAQRLKPAIRKPRERDSQPQAHLIDPPSTAGLIAARMPRERGRKAAPRTLEVAKIASPPVVLILVSHQPQGASPRFDFAQPWASTRRLMSAFQHEWRRARRSQCPRCGKKGIGLRAQPAPSSASSYPSLPSGCLNNSATSYHSAATTGPMVVSR
jgi:hypothetical protein